MTLTAIQPLSMATPLATTPPGAAPAPSAQKAAALGAATSSKPKPDHKIREVAREFEALLVRQMLTAAGMGGNGKDGVYGGMEVDALAKGVTKGHGLGLAEQIANALARETHGHKDT
jgi:Rod binding domain-containing protein